MNAKKINKNKCLSDYLFFCIFILCVISFFGGLIALASSAFIVAIAFGLIIDKTVPKKVRTIF